MVLSPGDLEPRPLAPRALAPRPEGWGPPGAARAQRPRRRRSATQMPALVSPADIPDDAAGRVRFMAIHAPDDVVPEHVPGIAEAADRLRERLRLRDHRGWIAVALVAMLLAALLLAAIRFS